MRLLDTLRFALMCAPICVWMVGAACAQDSAVRGAQTGELPSRTDSLDVVGAGPFVIHPFMRRGSEQIWKNGLPLPDSLYVLDYRRGLVTFSGVAPDSAFTFVARYQYVPLQITSNVRLWMNAEPDGTGEDRVPVASYAQDTATRLSGLNRSGSVTRGILTGSGRDAAIESGLRLELQGEIAPGVDVRASLSDEDTPILPEGTTRRLDQFDRVFIELASDIGTATLGDIRTRLTSGRFAHLDRQLQGGQLSSSSFSPSDLVSVGPVKVVGATSRGQFRVQSLTAQEGVQGPYRLQGANGETFVLVLPGSERVYLDGALLSRGAAHDYTIDYTTAEITFTPRRIIGSDRRIRVEFEYTTQQFTRTLLLSDAVAGWGRSPGGTPILEIGVTAIRESDGDQFTDEFSFSDADSAAVRRAGDASAFRSGAVQVDFDPEALFTQYVKETRVLDGETIEIFTPVQSRPPAGTAVYRVTFTRIGPGEGSYERTGSAVNGIVYTFVGSGNGTYEPVRSLPTPDRRQLLDIRFGLTPARGVFFRGEWAASRLDRNLISTRDDGDNLGRAYALNGGAETGDLSLGSIEIGRFSVDASTRRRAANFRTFDRVRSIEFSRDWNLRGRSVDERENIIPDAVEVESSLQGRLVRPDSSRLVGSWSRLKLGSAYDGGRLQADVDWFSLPWSDLHYTLDRVVTRDTLLAGREEWTRQRLRIERRGLAGIQPFLEFEHEAFEGRTSGGAGPGDSPTVPEPLPPDFLEARAGMRWTGDPVDLSLFVERRDEQSNSLSGRRGETVFWTSRLEAAYQGTTDLTTRASVGVRLADEAVRNTPTESPQSDALLIQWTGSSGIGTRSDISWLYDAQSERSATLQEIYIRTGQERGRFVWDDLNDDGAIQIEEFLPETTPGEGEYVRTFIPSDSLTAVTSITARIRLNRRSDRRKEVGSSLMDWLRRIGSSTLVEVREKSRNTERAGLYLLNLSTFRDELHTLNGRIRVRQELELLPGQRTSDLDITIQDARSLSDLAAGAERTQTRIADVYVRRRLTDIYALRGTVGYERDTRSSGSFSSRTFDIRGLSAEPVVDIDLSDRFSISPAVFGSSRRNLKGGERSRILRFSVDGLYQSGGSMRVSARSEINVVNVDGDSFGLGAFELTDGRGRGTSYLWHLGLQWLLNDNLTANAVYDGRAPEGRAAIHTARFQLTARF